MAMTESRHATTDGARTNGRVELDSPEETRRSFKTTELYVLLASVAAVIVVGYASDDSLNAFRIWLLVTILAAAYMVSRGIAKAGSYEHRSDIELTRNT
jgi:hypothetical protein